MFAFSISDLRNARACDLNKRISELPPGYAETAPIPLSVWWNLPSTSVADMWWSIHLLWEEGRAPAVACAEKAAARAKDYAAACAYAAAWAEAAYAAYAADAADAAAYAAYAADAAAYARAAYAAYADAERALQRADLMEAFGVV